MDRKTEYDFAKTILMLERMGLKEAAAKLEQEIEESEDEEQVNEEEIATEEESLEEEHDCEEAHPGQSHEEYTASKNESVKLKGMTKAELTETIKEIIKQKLNKRSK